MTDDDDVVVDDTFPIIQEDRWVGTAWVTGFDEDGEPVFWASFYDDEALT